MVSALPLMAVMPMCRVSDLCSVNSALTQVGYTPGASDRTHHTCEEISMSAEEQEHVDQPEQPEEAETPEDPEEVVVAAEDDDRVGSDDGPAVARGPAGVRDA
jgi:hypothetical protein